jgi:hypothetical protein
MAPFTSCKFGTALKTDGSDDRPHRCVSATRLAIIGAKIGINERHCFSRA